MKVLGVVGSKRKTGNTAYLVENTLDAIKSSEIETEIIYLGDYNIKGCTGCEGCKYTYKCIIQDDMQKLYPLIIEADAIVLGSSTYFYNITSLMKAFIERFYCFQIFDQDDRSVWSSVNEVMGGKLAVVIAVCEQDDVKDMGFTADAMSKPLEGLGYRVVETVKILKLYKKDDAKHSEVSLELVQAAAEKLKKTMTLTKSTKNKLIQNPLF